MHALGACGHLQGFPQRLKKHNDERCGERRSNGAGAVNQLVWVTQLSAVCNDNERGDDYSYV